MHHSGNVSVKPGMARPVTFLAIISVFILVYTLFFVFEGQRSMCSVYLNLTPAQSTATEVANNSSFPPATEQVDRFHGGLLLDGFDESSCVSRYEIAKYWKHSSYKPSQYLIEKLRKYEVLHKKCAPGTELYNKSVEALKNKHVSNQTLECNYVIYIASSGLGNRLISLISSFLYALLTDKVLLLRFPNEMQDLFCEPFPNSSWILSTDFPLKDYERVNNDLTFGHLVERKELVLGNSTDDTKIPSYAYLNLQYSYSEIDKQFFCEESQVVLQKVPWLFTWSNQYFAPAFIPMSMYSPELEKLFPEKQTMFLHLARYLLHPTNSVWGIITRYYEAYLANANERIGLQIRAFPNDNFEEKFSRFLNCTQEEGILPIVNHNEYVTPSINQSVNLKAVLIASLNLGYSDKLRAMYNEHPTNNGDIIEVFQPTHEGEQSSEEREHNAKALVEVFLLSFSDKLVISPMSTFGYVAQALGGLRPWNVYKHSTPFCERDKSIEPCYHFPPFYDCKAGKSIDKNSEVPPLKQCVECSICLTVVD